MKQTGQSQTKNINKNVSSATEHVIHCIVALAMWPKINELKSTTFRSFAHSFFAERLIARSDSFRFCCVVVVSHQSSEASSLISIILKRFRFFQRSNRALMTRTGTVPVSTHVSCSTRRRNNSSSANIELLILAPKPNRIQTQESSYLFTESLDEIDIVRPMKRYSLAQQTKFFDRINYIGYHFRWLLLGFRKKKCSMLK